MSLLDYARNEYSQNGEDGILEHVFSVVGEGTRHCCEFGAWDGTHLSNTRALILRGWSGLLIEGDTDRFVELERTYAERPDVRCVQAFVGPDTPLSAFLAPGESLDFLSIDIDGLDYESMESAGVTPRLICVEVNAGHAPDAPRIIDRDVASRVGQPLATFTELAYERGYRLIGYTGNAFYLHSSEGHEDELPTLSPSVAYAEFLAHLDVRGREWLYLVNRGLVHPHFGFGNSQLDRRELGLSLVHAAKLRCFTRAT